MHTKSCANALEYAIFVDWSICCVGTEIVSHYWQSGGTKRALSFVEICDVLCPRVETEFSVMRPSE